MCDSGCNWVPSETDLEEQIVAAEEHGFIPAVVIFVQSTGGERDVNMAHVHFAWRAGEEQVIGLAVLLVNEMMTVMREKAAERARRN